MRYLITALIVALLASPAPAATIGQFQDATQPLSGSDLVPVYQPSRFGEKTGKTTIDLILQRHTLMSDPHPQYTTEAEAAAAAPVQRVNNKSPVLGNISLDYSDVGAAPSNAISTHTGDIDHGPILHTNRASLDKIGTDALTGYPTWNNNSWPGGGDGGGGGGDMYWAGWRALFDASPQDNIIDRAATVPWTGVTDPPSTYAPSAHKNSHTTGQPDALSPGDIGAATAEQGGRADTAHGWDNHANAGYLDSTHTSSVQHGTTAIEQSRISTAYSHSQDTGFAAHGLTYASFVQLAYAANPGITFIVSGPSAEGSNPPTRAMITEQYWSFYTSLGIPESNLIWNRIGESGGGGIMSLAPLTLGSATVSNITLTRTGGSFALASLTGGAPIVGTVSLSTVGGPQTFLLQNLIAGTPSISTLGLTRTGGSFALASLLGGAPVVGNVTLSAVGGGTNNYANDFTSGLGAFAQTSPSAIWDSTTQAMKITGTTAAAGAAVPMERVGNGFYVRFTVDADDLAEDYEYHQVFIGPSTINSISTAYRVSLGFYFDGYDEHIVVGLYQGTTPVGESYTALWSKHTYELRVQTGSNLVKVLVNGVERISVNNSAIGPNFSHLLVHSYSGDTAFYIDDIVVGGL